MTTFCWLKNVEPTLGSSVVARISITTLLFGWKISPFVYQSTGLVETNFFRSSGILCLLYIDCRNGQLQEDLNRAPYSKLQTVDEYNKNVFVLLMMFLFPF